MVTVLFSIRCDGFFHFFDRVIYFFTQFLRRALSGELVASLFGSVLHFFNRLVDFFAGFFGRSFLVTTR